MRQTVAKLLYRQLKYHLDKKGEPMTKRAYRTLKKMWQQTPAPKRQYFFQ